MTEPTSTPVNITEQAVTQIENKVAALEATDIKALITYKEFWAAAKYVNELIRSSKFLDVELLAAFRTRIDAICEQVKTIQDDKGKTLDKVSQVKREAIEQKIALAKSLITSENQKAQDILKEALANIKNEWGKEITALNLTDLEAQVKMSREDQEAVWLLWKQVNEESFVHFKEIKQNNYIRISNEVYALGELVENADPFDAIEAIKEFQIKLKGLVLEKTDWDELRATLSKYWNLADERFKSNKANRNSQRIDRKKALDQRKEHWQVRQESNIQKFNDLISKNFDVITKIEHHIEKLEGDLLAARSEEFKTKLQGWIKEQKDKIEDIIKSNRELNDKIADIENKITEVENGKDPYHRNNSEKTEAAAIVEPQSKTDNSTTNDTQETLN
jgi:hypothetical protein